MINLLPPHQIKELKEEENFAIFLNLVFLFSIFLLAVFLTTLSIKFYLSGLLDYHKIILQEGEKILDPKIEQQIKEANDLLIRINSFLKKKTYLFSKIEEFSTKIPPGISLESLSLSLEKEGEVSFSVLGLAKKRENFLEMIKILKENYNEVSFPPEVFLKEENIEFLIKFKTK
jgi:hypothetical protein